MYALVVEQAGARAKRAQQVDTHTEQGTWRRCVSAQAWTSPFPGGPPEKYEGKESTVEQGKVRLLGNREVCGVIVEGDPAQCGSCGHVSMQLRISVVLCDKRKHGRCGTNLAEADLREFAAL